MALALVPSVVLAVVYLVWAPPSADLAAQTFRVDLFELHGYEIWSNAWYSGFHLPGYSLVYPPLASIFGMRLVAAVAAVVAAGLFAAIVMPRYGDRAKLAIFLFGLGTATSLFSGRLTFAVGVAFGLAAVLALDRDRPVLAGVLAGLTSFASPVAGLFAAFAGGVEFVLGRRRDGIALAGPALAGIIVISLGFPNGGMEPFAANTFWLISIATLLVLFLAPPDERTIRIGALLYLVMCTVLAVFDTPIGGNATRLGALFAAPLFALATVGRRSTAVVAVALVPLLYWQWVAPVRDLADAVGEPSVEEGYYDPLLEEIDRVAPDEPFRVQIPPTRNRWEAVYVAAEYPLARGWMRQLESDDFDLFEHGNLDADGYREWLDDRGVALIAVSRNAEPDYLSNDEIDLIDSGLPYLHQVWSNDDWDLYEIDDPAPLADPPATLTDLGDDSFNIEVPRPGEYLVRVRFSPYWEVDGGRACVDEEGEWTRVTAGEAGTFNVDTDFSVGAFFRALAGSGLEICSD